MREAPVRMDSGPPSFRRATVWSSRASRVPSQIALVSTFAQPALSSVRVIAHMGFVHAFTGFTVVLHVFEALLAITKTPNVSDNAHHDGEERQELSL
jgi:hypothetical protein